MSLDIKNTVTGPQEQLTYARGHKSMQALDSFLGGIFFMGGVYFAFTSALAIFMAPQKFFESLVFMIILMTLSSLFKRKNARRRRLKPGEELVVPRREDGLIMILALLFALVVAWSSLTW